MNKSMFSNISVRFQLEIKAVKGEEAIARYFVKLIDIEQDDDKQNPLWIVELVADKTYQLTYEQVIVRELVMFGSLAECLNCVKDESAKHIERVKKSD